MSSAIAPYRPGIVEALAEGARLWLARSLYRMAAQASGERAWVQGLPGASFFEPTYRALTEEAVRKNGIVFACLQRHSFAYPEPGIRVVRERKGGAKEPVVGHELTRLLRRPNPQMSGADLKRLTAIYRAVGGNAYWLKTRNKGGEVVELWPAHDGQISPVPGRKVLVSHYELAPLEEGAEPERLPVEDVVHFRWMPDPLEPWRGLAPLRAVAREVDTDNEAGRYLYAVLKNDATPRLLLRAPKDARPLDETQKKILTDEWMARYGGENRGRPAILGGGLEVERLSLDFQELAFEALRRLPEARISGAFGVPAVLAGLTVGLENATYANVAGLRREMAEGVLSPQWAADGEVITSQLLYPDFGGRDDELAEFALEDVSALQEAQKEKRASSLESFKSGGITRDQYRSELGLAAAEGGDVWVLPSSVTIVPVKDGPVPPKAPAPIIAPPGLPPAQLPPGAKPEGDQTPPGSDQGGEGGQGNKPPAPPPNGKPPAAPPGGAPPSSSPTGNGGSPGGGPAKGGLRRILRELEASGANVKELGPRDWARALLSSLEGNKAEVTTRAEAGLDRWFGELAEHSVARAKSWEANHPSAGTLPPVSALLTQADRDQLAELLGGYMGEHVEAASYLLDEVLEAESGSRWEMPAEYLERVHLIHQTTTEALERSRLEARVRGWDTEQWLKGDQAQGIRSVKSLVYEAYSGRFENIARTEIGSAGNLYVASRSWEASLEELLIGDGKLPDSDEACIQLDGTTCSPAWAQENLLAHPRCTRTFAPVPKTVPTF